MFVIELVYKADLAKIDAHMAAHVKFLKKYYAAGHFLVSGRKIPRDGGIIVAVGESREQVQAIVDEDPFVARGLAEARIIEFRASQRADDIDARIARQGSSWLANGRDAPPVTGWGENASGSSTSTTSPARMNTMRCASSRANPISCVTTSIVMPSSASETMVSSTSRVIAGSSADVGSSNSM